MNWATKNIDTNKLLVFAMIGVLSIMFSDFPILDKFSIPKWTVLIQPLILSILFIFLGLYSLKKASYPFKFKNQKELIELNKNGLVVGTGLSIVLGVLLFFITPYFESLLPSFLKDFNISLITKIFYGGINEEFIMRLGLLSFLYLIFIKFINNRKSVLLALIISSFLFALGHLPILYIDGIPNFYSVLFVVVANSFFGLIFGYLYIRLKTRIN